MSKKFSISYAILYVIAWCAARVFYRHFSISGKKKFPRRPIPTVVVSNHQNGMMDPMMTSIASRRPLHWLTRADLFKSRLSNKILRHLNMLPVYRQHDQVNDIMGKNQESFSEAVDLILNGRVISLFPEGNHAQHKSLRPLKKGLARIVFMAAEKSDFKEDIAIIACGLDYSEYSSFRADLLIRFSSPLYASKYYDTYQEDPKKAMSDMMADVKNILGDCMLNIRSKTWYKLIISSFPYVEDVVYQQLELKASPINRLVNHQHIAETLQNLSTKDDNTLHKLAGQAEELEHFQEEHGIAGHELLWPKPMPLLMPLLTGLLFSPVLIYGFLVNAPLALWIANFVKRKVKDPHFTSSITIAMGMLLFPIWWSVLSLILGYLFPFDWSFLVWFICSAASAIITLRYKEWLWKELRYRKIKDLKRRAPKQFQTTFKLASDFRKELLDLM